MCKKYQTESEKRTKKLVMKRARRIEPRVRETTQENNGRRDVKR